MDPISAYALGLAGVFVLMMCRSLTEAIPPFFGAIRTLWDKYLRLPYLIKPSRWTDGRTRLEVLRQATIIAISLCAIFLLDSTRSLTARTGYISVVQMVPCYLAIHMPCAAGLFCMHLTTFRILHIEFGIALVVATTTHVISAVKDPTLSLRSDDRSRYGIISASVLALLVVLCAVYVRNISYEVFLRSHQLLAIGMCATLWYHISGTTIMFKWYALGVAIPPGAIVVIQILQMLFRERFFYYGMPRARITTTGNSTSILLSSPVTFEHKAGQYVNLYLPGLSLRSAFESHPYMILPVAQEIPGQHWQLMVKPSRGWSRRLLERAERGNATDLHSYRAFFSGPHGRSISVNEFGTVVLVATQWGIMAQLPYLEHLIQSSHDSCTNVQKACLIWQLDHLDQGAPVRELLNHALRRDSCRDRYIITVMIFHRHGHISPSQREIGHHHRVAFFEGEANWRDLISSQVFAERHTLPESVTLPTSATNEDHIITRRSLPRTLVTVSADRETRREVREAVLAFVDSRVELSELDYQPKA